MVNMDKKDYPILLTRHLDALMVEWKKVSGEIIDSCRTICPEGSGLADKFISFLEVTGKFIRPNMFLFGYRLGGVEPDEKIIRLAISFELLHTYLLIEDDIIDQSDLRRGISSVHKLAEEYHQKNLLLGDSKHFGVSIAITFGLAICAKACEIWSNAEMAGIALPQSRKIFDRMHYDVSWGQYLDVMIPTQRKIPTKEVIIQIMEEKTSKYTIKNPLQSGAVQGGVSHENILWIAEFGKQLGIAYQIVDDILGVYGKPSVTGKPIDSDIHEGKETLLVWSALESATFFDRKVMIDFYTGNDRSDTAIASIKNIFNKYDVRSKAEGIATEYVNRALEIVHTAPITYSAKQELKIFSKFIIERNK